MRPIPTLSAFLLLATGPWAQDFGDAPDSIPGCQAEPTCDEPVAYPTLPGTLNAVPGRDAPVHFPSFPGTDFWLGGPATSELSPELACCDWVSATVPADCDDDDGALVLGLGPTPGAAFLLISGVFAGPDINCTERIASCFGPSPINVVTGECWGVWFIESTTAPGAPPLPRFLNVVVDWNLSGVFGDLALEWALTDAAPAGPGTSTIVTSIAFPVLTAGPNPMAPGGWEIGPFWTRALVSTEPLEPVFPAMDWDGSGVAGGYVGGETEDWVVLCDPDGPFTDCNRNGRPDALDIWTGTSHDLDRNGVPDECRRVLPRSPLPPTVTGTRQL